MHQRFLPFCLGALMAAGAAGQSVQVADSVVRLATERQTLSFDLRRGLFDVADSTGAALIRAAYFQVGGIQSKETAARRTYAVDDVADELGRGKRLTVRVVMDDYPDALWQVTAYDSLPAWTFRAGLDNDTRRELRLTTFSPVVARQTYPGTNPGERYQVLEGAGGGARTLVRTDAAVTSFNNLMAKFGPARQPRILVAGGISYHDFEKFVTVERAADHLSLRLFAEDPVGRLVRGGETYLPDERFYLRLDAADPFTALEQYAAALHAAQHIRLNAYDFPTECLWYASFYNNEPGRRKFNDSRGAVEEMERADSSGLTRFARWAVRLVPDAYSLSNQQGWWDDAHWGMYGEGMSTEGPHYTAPYLTTASWAQAVTRRGGLPFTYFQSGRHSEDYARRHPGHMLFNDPRRPIAQPERFTFRVNVDDSYGPGYYNQWWTDNMLWGYDFTDPGFIRHMEDVYRNLRQAGIRGIMYDYPEVTAWAFEGGFEDREKTTAWAYRNMYQLAYDGLGPDCYLGERNLLRGSDVTLGLVASQRVWADTDGITPEMVTRCGLRWYKNRLVVNYDMDSKDPCDAVPRQWGDGRRSMLTMCYVVSGRLLLGRSASQLSLEERHDLSRVLPFHTQPQSARPLDAFNEGTVYPRVYDFAVTPDWHQLTLYNPNLDMGAPGRNVVNVPLSASLNEGGPALRPDASYHVYDFWNDRYVGCLPGNGVLSQTLREGEARMLSVRRAENHPQYISTSRHIMQGYLDMKACAWDEASATLAGTAAVVADDPYRIVVAGNGRRPRAATAEGATATLRTVDEARGLYEVCLRSRQSADVRWSLSFF